MRAPNSGVWPQPRPRLVGGAMVAAAILLLASCAARVSGLSVDPSFSYTAAVAKGVSVAVVESSIGGEQNWNQLFVGAIKDEAPSVLDVDSVDLSATIDADTLQTLLEEFRQQGTLTPGSRAQIARQVSRPNYLVFVHLQNDETRKSRHAIDRAPLSTQQTHFLRRTTTTRTTSRSIMATAMVIDPADGAEVWRGTVNPWVANTNTRSSYQLLYSVDYDWHYPRPPSLERAVRAALSGIAENLPLKP